jgi:transposase InsO family protein
VDTGLAGRAYLQQIYSIPSIDFFPLIFYDQPCGRDKYFSRQVVSFLLRHSDWATRNVLSWRLSNTLTTDFCLDAVEEALSKYGKPKIFNTDQGSQFTDSDFVKLIKGNGILVSMDGKGS